MTNCFDFEQIAKENFKYISSLMWKRNNIFDKIFFDNYGFHIKLVTSIFSSVSNVGQGSLMNPFSYSSSQAEKLF